MRTMLDASVATAAAALVTAVLAASGCARSMPTPASPDLARADGPAVPVCTPAGPLAAPADLPETLRPPGYARLFLRLRAEGNQIYRCQKNDAGAWAFALKAPDARLISDRCTEVGHHSAGPSWSLAADGSVVVGKKLAEAPRAGTIPWLLLTGTPTSPAGALGSVRFIQRVDTTGGIAPVEGCDEASAGREVAIPYRATYLLYQPLLGTLKGSRPPRDELRAAKLRFARREYPPGSWRAHYRPTTLPVAAVSNSRS